jgi:hypothetical protein
MPFGTGGPANTPPAGISFTRAPQMEPSSIVEAGLAAAALPVLLSDAVNAVGTAAGEKATEKLTKTFPWLGPWVPAAIGTAVDLGLQQTIYAPGTVAGPAARGAAAVGRTAIGKVLEVAPSASRMAPTVWRALATKSIVSDGQLMTALASSAVTDAEKQAAISAALDQARPRITEQWLSTLEKGMTPEELQSAHAVLDAGPGAVAGAEVPHVLDAVPPPVPAARPITEGQVAENRALSWLNRPVPPPAELNAVPSAARALTPEQVAENRAAWMAQQPPLPAPVPPVLEAAPQPLLPGPAAVAGPTGEWWMKPAAESPEAKGLWTNRPRVTPGPDVAPAAEVEVVAPAAPETAPVAAKATPSILPREGKIPAAEVSAPSPSNPGLPAITPAAAKEYAAITEKAGLLGAEDAPGVAADRGAALQLALKRTGQAKAVEAAQQESSLSFAKAAEDVIRRDATEGGTGLLGNITRSVGAAGAGDPFFGREDLWQAASRRAGEMNIGAEFGADAQRAALADVHPIGSVVPGAGGASKVVAGKTNEGALILMDPADPRVPEQVIERVLALAFHPNDVSKVSDAAWFRPCGEVLKEVGLGPLYEMWMGQKTRMVRDMAAMGERIIGTYKKYGIRVGNDLSKGTFLVMDGREAEIAFLSAADQASARSAAAELRPVMDELKGKFDPEGTAGYINEYITHLWRTARNNPDVLEMTENELRTMMGPRTRTKAITDPFLENERTGAKGYIEDVVTALDAYARAGYKMTYLKRPAAETAKLLGSAWKDAGVPDLTKRYVEAYFRYQLGTPTDIERVLGEHVANYARKVERVAGYVGARGIAARARIVAESPDFIAWRRTVEWARGNVFLGALGGAVDSAVTNLSQGLNTFAEAGPVWWARGMSDMAMVKAGDRELAEILRRSNVLTEGNWSLILEGSHPALRQQLGDKMMYLFQQVETVNRSTAFFAGYRKALAAGSSEAEAMALGEDLAARTQFRYMSTDTPLFFQSTAGKVLGQLGSFPARQLEWLSPIQGAKGLAGNAQYQQEAQRLVRYVLGSILLSEGAGAVGLDIRSAIWPIVPDDKGPLAVGSFRFRPGFIRPGFGPMAQAAIGIGQVGSGSREGVNTLRRTVPLLVPGGRAAVNALRNSDAGVEALKTVGLASKNTKAKKGGLAGYLGLKRREEATAP